MCYSKKVELGMQARVRPRQATSHSNTDNFRVLHWGGTQLMETSLFQELYMELVLNSHSSSRIIFGLGQMGTYPEEEGMTL